MPVNLMYANIYLAQVDEETVEPGAKIAGCHTLFHYLVMSSLFSMFAISEFFCLYKNVYRCPYIFCHL
jgi:hypothetical protein